jgi:hypothetical protein
VTTFNAIPHRLTIDEKSAKKENLAIWPNTLKLGNLQTPQGKKTLGVKRPQGILYPRERQNPLKLPVQPGHTVAHKIPLGSVQATIHARQHHKTILG